MIDESVLKQTENVKFLKCGVTKVERKVLTIKLSHSGLMRGPVQRNPERENERKNKN